MIHLPRKAGSVSCYVRPGHFHQTELLVFSKHESILPPAKRMIPSEMKKHMKELVLKELVLDNM
jgi:hypothetical protein